MTEVVIASCITIMISAGVMTCFLWCGDRATLAVKIGWSQNEAMRISNKLTDYVRNAKAVVDIDATNGLWVKLLLTNGVVAKLEYFNTTNSLRDGRMFLEITNRVDTIVARGLTKIMDSTGWQAPIFSLNPNSNTLQVAYRISEPTASGGRESDDGDFAVCVRFGVYLRNIAR